MNGLVIDQADAIGLGALEGTQKIDIIQHSPKHRLAYGAPDHGTGKPVGEYYWRLLRALAHRADFVAVQESWQVQALLADMMLPRAEHWIVFRDREFSEQWWGEYGTSGEPGTWGRNVRLASKGEFVFQGPQEVGIGRWKFVAAEPVVLELKEWEGARATVTAMDGSGQQSFTVPVTDGRVELPSGTYCRVELEPARGDDGQELATRVERLQERVEALERWRRELGMSCLGLQRQPDSEVESCRQNMPPS